MAFPVAGALALFDLVPSLLKIFGKERPAEIVNKVGDLARVVTGAPDVNEAAKKLNETPELLQKFQLEVDSRAQDWARMYIEDMQHARARDMEIQKLRGANKRADALIIAAFGGVLLCGIGFLFVKEMTPQAEIFLSTVGGMLVMKIGTAFDFEFGSSADTASQGNLISKFADTFKRERIVDVGPAPLAR